MFKTSLLPVLGLTAALMGGTAAMAADENRVELGNLSCDVAEGSGFVFGSSKELTCTFNPAQDGLDEEVYVGTINRYGIDIGKTEKGTMSWLVLAPTSAQFPEGALTGEYGGLSAEATAGVGVGANALIGGSDETVVLQPISVTTQTGVNFAVGVAELFLQKAS